MSAEIFPTPLDWVALAVLLVSLLAGFMRGFLIEAIALCGWVGGFFLARAFAADVAAWLPMENSLPGVRLAAGFALIYVLAEADQKRLVLGISLAYRGQKVFQKIGRAHV